MNNYFHPFKKKYLSLAPKFNPETVLFLGVLIVAVVARSIAWFNSEMIAPDGTLYIGQARAIFYGQWDVIAACGGIRSLSLYPFLIAVVYNIFHDWVIAGQAINFVFGTATIVPVYMLLRQFVNYKISALTTLLVAVIPLFVSVSIEVLRDPMYWFFLAMGLYFFTVSFNKENNLFLLFSSIFFLLATAARIEAIIIFFASFLYLLWKIREIRKTFVFISPVLILIAFASIVVYLKDFSFHDFYRVKDVLGRMSNLFSDYFKIETGLKELTDNIDGKTYGSLKAFLSEARMSFWLVAIGMMANRIFEMLLYVLAVPFIVGFGQLKRIKKDPRLVYFMLLAASSLFVLYMSIFHIWVLERRYVVLFILPSLVFAAIGLELMVKWFGSRFRIKESIVIIALACFMIIFTLPRNIEPIHHSKLAYKEIGEFISTREKVKNEAIGISASSATQSWVSFYANLNYKGAICYKATKVNCWELFAKNDILISQLKERNIKYFLWTEKTWSNKKVDIARHGKYLKELGRWRHSNTGEMILFEVL
ncbi:MAG TPA: glycosyltransferase family 39 protein [Smithellaceae bacterium]|nr:glycosyltransferase family 39 protein [Smithellaceae bacterium]